MNARQHLEQAEAFLQTAPSPDAPGYSIIDIAISVNALAHAVIALAIEAGAPHGAAPAGVTQSGQ